MRALILAVLVGAGLACDPCSSMSRVHLERCSQGDANSCAWLDENNVDPFGACHA